MHLNSTLTRALWLIGVLLKADTLQLAILLAGYYVIHKGKHPRIICIILHIKRKANPGIVLLFIQNICFFQYAYFYVKILPVHQQQFQNMKGLF